MTGLLLSSIATAQPDATAQAVPEAPASDAPTSIELGYGALPGGLHVPAADDVPAGTLAVSGLSGFGYRKGLLGPDHRFGRVIGDLGVAYAPIAHLAIALTLDGRYDKHYGLPPSGDDGYVGDPRIHGRYTTHTGSLDLGGQVGVWLPGKSAPSIAGSAISVDLQVFATLAAGPGRLSLDAGFRFDNSDKSVTDMATLSLQDRVSLGVSDFNEVFGGVHYALPLAQGKAYLGFEGSVEAFVGTGAPGQIFRASLTAGYHVAPQWTLMAFVEGAKVPGLLLSDIAANAVTLIPYEPVVTGGLGLQATFGGPKKHETSIITKNDHPQDVAVIEYADVSGVVTDDAGAPVVGAKVTVTLKNHTGNAATDDKGAFTVAKLPIGKTVGTATTLDDTGAEISIDVDGKKPSKTTLALVKGANAVPKIVLEPVLPPGQLRGIVKSLASGKPIANASITITPGGKVIQSGADGTFQVDLAPGSYKITVTAPQMANQDLDVTIDPNGVSLKNIDMHK